MKSNDTVCVFFPNFETRDIAHKYAWV